MKLALPPDQTLLETDKDSKPGDALFENKYVKYSLKEIKTLWNGAFRGYGKAIGKNRTFVNLKTDFFELTCLFYNSGNTNSELI